MGTKKRSWPTFFQWIIILGLSIFLVNLGAFIIGFLGVGWWHVAFSSGDLITIAMSGSTFLMLLGHLGRHRE